MVCDRMDGFDAPGVSWWEGVYVDVARSSGPSTEIRWPTAEGDLRGKYDLREM